MIQITKIKLLLFILFLLLSGMNAQHDSILVLINTCFIDVNKSEIISNVDIVIKGPIIHEIKKYSPQNKYQNAHIINLEGKFLIPGLIEGHTHISSLPEKCLTIALKKGVTALRDLGGDGAYLKILQDAVQSGELIGPDIYFSALMGGLELIKKDPRAKVSTPPNYQLGEAPWMRLVQENADISQVIKDAKECGAAGIKLYAYLSSDLVKKLSDEAKKNDLKVWAHWEVYPATPEEVINAGVDAVAHVYFLLTPPGWNYKDGSKILSSAFLSPERNGKLFSIMKTNNIFLDPTIVVAREMFSSMTDKKRVDELNEAVFKMVKHAYKSGVKISVGTDILLPADESKKLPLHEEMEVLVNKVGFTAADAVRAATISNAEVLGIEKTHGTIEVGKAANIVVLNGNPLENIYNIEKVEFVIKDGKIIQ